MVKGLVKFLSVVTASVLAFTLAAPALSSNAANYEWRAGENGKQYWYEFGVRQGTYDDPKGVIGDGTVRGREIYDSVSDGWYWLDSVYNGAKAIGKEVWMPYVYQNEASFDDGYMQTVAANSDAGMQDLVYRAMKNKTGKWVRYDENGKMIKGWVTITGALAEIYTDQVGNTYYYDHQTGIMAKGNIVIDGKTYHFDELTGKCTNYDGTVIDNSERDLTPVMHLTDATRQSHTLEEGDTAPDFTVQLVNGNSFTLSDHHDDLVVLNFWATWCGPCVREMPALDELANENIEGVSVVCINLGEDSDTVNEFVEKKGLTLNVGYDSDRIINAYYPTTGIPYTVFVRGGKVVHTTVGSMTYDTFSWYVDFYKNVYISND